MKHYKSVEILSIFRMSSPRTRQSPPIKNFLATVLSLLLIIFCPQEAQSYPNETRV